MSARSRAGVLGVLLTAVVLVVVASAVYMMGSPAQQRARKTDQRRVADLTNVGRALDLYWSRNGALPQSLQDLAKMPGGKVHTTDPATGESYEYRSLEGSNYELCAKFTTDAGEASGAVGPGSWSHGSGRQCFRREAQKIRGLSAQ
jgi:hypothetical protein